MTWEKAFLKQAMSDFSVYEEFKRGGKARCHQLHYLQMAAEKLAKSFTCPPNNTPPKPSHVALVKFLRACKKRPDVRRFLGFKDKRSAFDSFIDGLLPFAWKIEGLAPEGSAFKKPNPEYPWLNENGQVTPPVDFPFDRIWEDASRMGKLEFLMGRLMEFASPH